MNSIVKRWQKQQQKPRYAGPDTVIVDGVKLELGTPMAERKKPETEVQKPLSNKILNREAPKKITISRRAAVELALYGRTRDVDAAYRETYRTLVRLGLDCKETKAIGKIPRGAGSMPSIQDLIRWLDAIDGSKAYKDDRQWLVRFHATLILRVDPAVHDEITKRQFQL